MTSGRSAMALLWLWLMLACPALPFAGDLPPDFVELREVIPGIQVDLRYLGANNFVGEPIDGYGADRCLLTREAALALSRVQEELRPFGLGLKVFDAYRPQRAVDHFVRWAQDVNDARMKEVYYPQEDKRFLFERGYIAARSSHSRGSTVDLTIICFKDGYPGEELEMGTAFDFFGPESSGHSPGRTPSQRAHRMLLRVLMEKHGFAPYDQEWWHFTLKNEPYPDTYFDVPIE